MANGVKFSDLPQIENLNDVDKFLVGTSDGNFGYITAEGLRAAMVAQGVKEMLPDGYKIAITKKEE